MLAGVALHFWIRPVFGCSHVNNSPSWWTSWKYDWYGLWGAGHCESSKRL